VLLVTYLVPGFAQRLAVGLRRLDESESEVVGG
jgi:hypothetical protein